MKDHGYGMDYHVKLSRHVYRTDCEHGCFFFFDPCFDLKATVYDVSILLAQNNGDGACLPHLPADVSEDPVWPDMEYVMGVLYLEHMFFGVIPPSMEEAERKYCLALGVLPYSIARD